MSGDLQRRPYSDTDKGIAEDGFTASCTRELGIIPRPSRLESSSEELAQTTESVRQSYNLPALSSLVLSQGNVVQAATGVKQRGSDVAVAETDQFHLGSCGKAMTATMLACLVEEGVLSWDTTLAEAFPELAGKLSPKLAGASLKALIAHTSGLPSAFPSDIWRRLFFEDMPRSQLVELTVTDPNMTLSEPGTFIYSNVGYLFAGAMAERATGKTWEELMREKLFTPLGMHSVGFGPVGPNQPSGHDEQGNPVAVDWPTWRVNPIGPAPDNPPTVGPAGTMHCSMSDWAKFARAHLERNSNLLSAEGWKFLQTPEPGQRVTPGGWVAWEGNLAAEGSNTLNYSVAYLSLDKSTAVLAATNQGGKAANAIYDLLRKLT